MLKRAIFRLYRKARIIFFQLLSNQSPVGPLVKVQAVQVMGAGRITALGPVSIGYFPSPHFFSTYGYLEARGKDARIEIGSNTKINNGFVAIAEKSSITIGNNCLIGTRVEIYDSDFHATDPYIRINGGQHTCIPVKIGNNVFIGSNVRILKGVTIGDGAVIANGSLVTSDLPENSVALGMPAKVVKRFTFLESRSPFK